MWNDDEDIDWGTIMVEIVDAAGKREGDVENIARYHFKTFTNSL